VVGGIAALGLAGLLVALFIRRKRRETQSDPPA
jgi:LPXTG-motif cell wall-anchored protein